MSTVVVTQGTTRTVEVATAGPQGVRGAQGWVWQGPWDIATDYAAETLVAGVVTVGADVVQHDGSAWLAVADSTGVEPGTAPLTWELIAEKGEPTTLTVTATTLPVGEPATAVISGTAPAQTITFGLPTGATGATGPANTEGLQFVRGANLARFLARAQSGEDLTITCVGDSILEGHTVTNPATDGAMILLAADLSARYGITVTQTNHADSGATAATAHINGNITAAIAENADLYIVSAFDKNDLGGDLYDAYAAGYPLAASTAAVERIIRAIRTNVPKADIIVMTTNPYAAGTSTVPYQAAKDAAERRNAALYGCEFVDCFAAFVAYGDYSELSADSTHPNTAGHRLIADTILTHLEDVPRAPWQPGAVPPLGLHHPERVEASAGYYGYAVNGTPGSAGPVTYITGGTGWAAEATSAVGDYVEAVANCTEFLLEISTSYEDDAVVDVAVDGVTVAPAVALAETGGKRGQYHVPFALGLTPGTHTLRLTLVSGTLRTYKTVALIAGPAPFVRESVIFPCGSIVATTNMTTSSQTLLSTTATLPDGWGSMDIMATGYVSVRNSGAMTAVREISVTTRIATVVLEGVRSHALTQQGATFNHPNVRISGAVKGHAASVAVAVTAKVDNATDVIQTLATHLDLLLVRAS